MIDPAEFLPSTRLRPGEKLLAMEEVVTIKAV